MSASMINLILSEEMSTSKFIIVYIVLKVLERKVSI